jgi:metal-responsive CopG/Arc/MetJ family transcriptional regulator
LSKGQHKTVRLPEGLLERLEEIARAQGIRLSAAIRIALQRGVTALENEATSPAGSSPVRRKVYSKGVF